MYSIWYRGHTLDSCNSENSEDYEKKIKKLLKGVQNVFIGS